VGVLPIPMRRNPTSVLGIFQNKKMMEVVGVISQRAYKQKLVNSSSHLPLSGSMTLVPVMMVKSKAERLRKIRKMSRVMMSMRRGSPPLGWKGT
jgi:hypothetical protein